MAAAREAGVEPEFVDWPVFRRLTGLTDDDKHQGVCVFAKPRRVFAEHELDRLAQGRLVIALDQISDPQNLGAVLRSASFFGADAVLLLKNRSAELTPKVARIAVGGAEFVDVFRVTNLARSLDTLRGHGYWVYGLDEHPFSLRKVHKQQTGVHEIVGASRDLVAHDVVAHGCQRGHPRRRQSP